MTHIIRTQRSQWKVERGAGQHTYTTTTSDGVQISVDANEPVLRAEELEILEGAIVHLVNGGVVRFNADRDPRP